MKAVVIKQGQLQRRAPPRQRPRRPKLAPPALLVPLSLVARLHNPSLTRQESEVFLWFLELGSVKKVAVVLHTRPHTVHNQLRIVELKYGQTCRIELLLVWWKKRAEHCRVLPVPFCEVARRRNPSLTDRELEVLLQFLELGKSPPRCTWRRIPPATTCGTSRSKWTWRGGRNCCSTSGRCGRSPTARCFRMGPSFMHTLWERSEKSSPLTP